MPEPLTPTASTVLPALGPPRGLHHVAYVIRDAAETAEFYQRVLRMELVGFVIDDKVPSTGDAFPYVHLFCELGDGSTIAFFESVGLPPPAAASHPAYDVFNHLALDAGSKDNVDRWAEHLRAQGVEFLGPIDHHVIYSVYFHDPNGIRLELTATTNWAMTAVEAARDLKDWQAAKAVSRQQGGDTAPLMELIMARRAKHKASSIAVD